MRGGLRHRADRIQEHQPDPRLAVGDRAGVVPDGRRPVAGRDEYRPPQRRVVPGLSADHPLAHGPDLPARPARRPLPRKVREQSALADLDRQYTLSEIAIITRAGPGANPRPQEQGPPRPGCRRRYHDLYARLQPGDHVRAAALRHQGGSRSSSNRAKSARRPTARRCTSHPITTGMSRQTSSAGSRNRTRSSGGIILSTSSPFTITKWSGDDIVNDRQRFWTPELALASCLGRGYVCRSLSDDGRAGDRDDRHGAAGPRSPARR